MIDLFLPNDAILPSQMPSTAAEHPSAENRLARAVLEDAFAIARGTLKARGQLVGIFSNAEFKAIRRLTTRERRRFRDLCEEIRLGVAQLEALTWLAADDDERVMSFEWWASVVRFEDTVIEAVKEWARARIAGVRGEIARAKRESIALLERERDVPAAVGAVARRRTA